MANVVLPTIGAGDDENQFKSINQKTRKVCEIFFFIWSSSKDPFLFDLSVRGDFL